MEEKDWDALVLRARAGDEEAFGRLYQATKDHVYRMIVYLSPDRQDAADLMSEVYIALLRGLGQYRPEQPFRPWLNGIVVRQVRNWKRRSWRRFRLFEKLRQHKGTDASDDSSAALGDRLELVTMLDALPRKLREVVALRYYQDSSLEEIGALLGIPVGTVKSRLHLAMKRLRAQYGIDGFEQDKGEARRYVYGR